MTSSDKPLSPGTITDLVRKAQRGNLRAYERIVRHFQGPIRAWAIAHTPPGADADDVAQKTFIAAHQRLDEFEAGTDLAAWLFTIARYQLMTETTRLRRIADYHSRFAPELLDRELERYAEKETPEHIADRLDALRQCLTQLEAKSLELLHWRYDDGIPLRTMADRTGRTEGALKKHLFTIRRSLQTCIETRTAS